MEEEEEESISDFRDFSHRSPTRRERETYVGETYASEKPYIFDSERVELLRTTRIHVENAQRTERGLASKDVPLERGKPIVTSSSVTCLQTRRKELDIRNRDGRHDYSDVLFAIGSRETWKKGRG